MKVDIWMPIYIKDYLADTSRLSTLEHGTYMLLLFDYWINGPLPNDNEVLLQITKLKPINLPVIRALLKSFFFLDKKIDKFRQKRADIEIAKATHRREIAFINGKKGGRPNNQQVNRPVNPKVNLQETSSPAPAPAPISSSTSAIKGGEGRFAPSPAHAGVFSFENIWNQYPNKIGRKEAERHFEASVKNDQDYKDISAALAIYLKTDRVKNGFVQNGSTWFNNWRDWVEYKEPVKSDKKDENSMDAVKRGREELRREQENVKR